MIGHVYFWVCAIVALLGALATVTARNPIRGAMGLLAMILSLAGLFLALHAQFLAAIQLIVYAGAIVVLFLFVIMLLGPSATSPRDARGRIPRILAASLFAITGLGATGLVVKMAPEAQVMKDALPGDFGGIDTFGRILFTSGVVPFELSSALLMVAVLGAIAVARGRHSSDGHGPVEAGSGTGSPDRAPLAASRTEGAS